MKTKTNQTLYFCEHCNKFYFRKRNCEKHEPICKHNPENHGHCFGCKHDTTKAINESFDSHYCNLKQVFTTPIYMAKQGRFHKNYAGIENVPMPKIGTCKEYEVDNDPFNAADSNFEFSESAQKYLDLLAEIDKKNGF